MKDKLADIAKGNLAKAELDLEVFLASKNSIPEHIDFSAHALILIERVATARDILTEVLEL